MAKQPQFSIIYTHRKELLLWMILGIPSLWVALPYMSRGRIVDCGVYLCPPPQSEAALFIWVMRVFAMLALFIIGWQVWLEFRALRIMAYRREVTVSLTSLEPVEKEAGTSPTLFEYLGLGLMAFACGVGFKLFNFTSLLSLVWPVYIGVCVFYFFRESRVLKSYQA